MLKKSKETLTGQSYDSLVLLLFGFEFTIIWLFYILKAHKLAKMKKSIPDMFLP